MITRRNFLKVGAATGALASMGNLTEAKIRVENTLQVPAYCKETARQIPVIQEVDLVVVGGSSAAVVAAATAAKAGRSVFLVAYMPYLGEDICGTFQYRIDKRVEQPQTTLARRIFMSQNDPREEYPQLSERDFLYKQQMIPTPMYVKTELEKELIQNKVDFLYSSYVTNVLTDPEGRVAGVVIANRSGRQAIRAKAVIDTTITASVAQLFGVPFQHASSTLQEFAFTVVGNAVREHPAIRKAEVMPFTVDYKDKKYPMTRYTFYYPLRDRSYAGIMEAEQFIRDLTWDADQVDSSDLLEYTPTWQIVSQQEDACPYRSLEEIPQEPFVPTFSSYIPTEVTTITSPHALPMTVYACQGKENLWVLGPCAAVPRDIATWLMHPVNNMTAGEMLGEWVAEKIESDAIPALSSVLPLPMKATDCGQVHELLSPLRPDRHKGWVEAPGSALPVLGKYDVVVVGGGTAGAPAGISSARHGVKTLVLEYLHGLGGMTTVGFIGRYWDGYREGFTAEIDRGVREMAPSDHPRQMSSKVQFCADWKNEWFRSQLRKSKADLWYGILGCGVLVRGNKVAGVVIATPFGRGVVLANVVIDSTGSADIAIAAKTPFEYTGKATIAVQGAGLSQFNPNDSYNNTDWTLVDESDVLDTSRLYIQGKVKFKECYDLGKLPQTRERRRILGEYTISVYDVINHRRYADTISYHKSSFDTHGMTIDPYFTLNPPGKRHVIYEADVPLRSLLPKGMEAILVTGLGASAHRDAMPVIRMQPCLQNQGYSVGYLAALAVKERKPLREISIKKIQKYLVEKNILPARVLSDKDTKSFSDKDFARAALTVTNQYLGLEILLTAPAKCAQVIRRRIQSVANEEERLLYASILCMIGDNEYASLLADKIRSYERWDEGWHYTASDQFGKCMSRLDSYIIALGNSKNEAMLSVILEKAALLRLEDHFSHYRAIALATEAIQSTQAAPVLTKLLRQGGLQHYETTSYSDAVNKVVPYIYDVSFRDKILKELHLAKSLYRCGDQEGIAQKVLRRYENGLEAHYARFAAEILAPQN